MRKDRRGNMPFAVIAITLLVLSLFCGAAAAEYERAADTTDGIREDTAAVDRAASDFERHIDRGLGEIILQVSGDPTLGAMPSRAAEFDTRAEEWIADQFPLAGFGVRADLLSQDVDLGTRNLMNVDGGDARSGRVPAYLQGTGTVTVRIHVGSGETVRTLDICTDGSYALPLTAEQGSMFENMVGDGGPSISQMMEYQLSCLAQYRVVNGYGCDNRFGGRSTADILTKEDVTKAYSNSLAAIGLICFRDPDGDLDLNRDTDLADYLIQDGGKLRLDFSVFFAQSLYGLVDRIAVQWFEYFCGDRIANELLKPISSLIDVGRSLKAALLGQDTFGAQSYIREAMERSSYGDQDWQHVGGGSLRMTIYGRTVFIATPVTDVLELDWIKHFQLNRRIESNFVLDSMTEILRDASVKASGGRGVKLIDLDPHDPETFAETLSKAFDANVGSFKANFEGAVKESVSNPRIYDPFCIEIADKISQNRDGFMDMDGFKENVRAQLLKAFAKYQGNPKSLYHIDKLMKHREVRLLEDKYRASISGDLERFDALRNQPGSSNILKEIMSGIASVGLGKLGMLAPVEDAMQDVVGEMARTVSMNPHSGITGISGKDCFRLQDESGNRMRERLDSVVSSNPVVERPYFDSSKSVHRVGFDRDVCASFVTTFVVDVYDDIGYTVRNSSALADSLGITTAAVDGAFSNHIHLEIPVVSAWGLAGVRYEGSTNIVNDAVKLVMDFLEPVLEPLMKTVAMIRAAMTVAVERLVELGRCAADAVEEAYRTVMEPLNDLYNWMYANVSKVLADHAICIYNYIRSTGQGMHVSFMGFVLKFETDAASWAKNTKSLIKVSLAGMVSDMHFEAGLHFKYRGEARAENLGIVGFGELKGDGWSLKAHADPALRFSKHLLTLDGRYRGTDISMVLPELVEYHELGVTLSDVPGVGPMLSNIPVPMLGAKASVDAGLSLKYSDPVKTGLMVNEFESDPPGPDSGMEWVELYNNSKMSVCLDGYVLSASSDRVKKTMTLSGTMSPGEYLVVHPDFQLVNESGKYTKKGEGLVLRDPEGDVVDKTPTLRDNKNGEETWQRNGDGSTEWVFGTPTPGSPNRSGGLTGSDPPAMVGIAMEAATKALDDIGVIDDTASLQDYVKLVVQYTLDGIIDHVTGSVVDASLFVSLELKDLTGSASSGMRIALRADRGLVEDTLRYIAGQLEEVLLHADNPYGIDPVGMFTENIGLDLTFSAGVGAPDLLTRNAPEVKGLDLGVMFRTDIAAMTRLAGCDTGRPELVFGVKLLDCPCAVIPERLRADPVMDHDLWLLKTTVAWE